MVLGNKSHQELGTLADSAYARTVRMALFCVQQYHYQSTAGLNMDTLPQKGEWHIVRLNIHQRHLQCLRHHPLIKILARSELTYGQGSAIGRNNAKLTR
jgi:hypothetical protein